MSLIDCVELDEYSASLTSCHKVFIQQVKNHRLHWSYTNLYPGEWKLVAPVGSFSARARAGEVNICSDGANFPKSLCEEKATLENNMICKNSDRVVV